MANHLPKAGIRQPKTIVRECNALLAGSGMVVRDWQLSHLEPVPMNERFTLELEDASDWQPIPDLYELHQQLLADAAKAGEKNPDALPHAPG